MQRENTLTQTDNTSRAAVRLHYLDTLRVLAVLVVFLFHASMPFTLAQSEIANAETSLVATLFFVAFLAPWGMPFFFLLAGAATWFALRRRTARQFAAERFRRLFIPFLVGCALFTPFQAYVEWMFRLRVGTYDGSYLQFFFVEHFNGWNPTMFGWLGYHLWFLGYLFVDSLLLLPLFEWLKGEAGRRVVSWLARLCEHRGGILVFALPLLLVQLGLRPFFPEERNWADFFYYPLFFLAGYLFYSDERFLRAVRRDRWLVLAVGIAALLGLMATVALGEAKTLFSTPGSSGFYLFWACAVVDAWCWGVTMLYIGMRFLDFSNKWTRYGQEAILPFYLLHQPVIWALAFYAVQWQAGVTIKMLAVVLASFVVTIGMYELLIRRVAPLRALFGMKGRPSTPVMQPREATPAGGTGTQPSA
ncbi:MAG: acyltransferase family protein [Candidatus Hodarchaeota archaeon]